MKAGQWFVGRRVRRLAALAFCASLVTGGCLEDRSFHQSDEIRFVEPIEEDFAQAPLLVRWEGKPDRTVKWAVFLDRAPIRPGASVDDLEVQERTNIWITDAPEYTVEFVPPRQTAVASRRDRHRLTVIPLDAKGKRVGEHAASVELTVIQG